MEAILTILVLVQAFEVLWIVSINRDKRASDKLQGEIYKSVQILEHKVEQLERGRGWR
jgi:hypothetical protein